MNKFFINNYILTNVYNKRSLKSEVVTQLLYGDTFLILKKNSKWLKIKILEDSYVGFIKTKKYLDFSSPTHKVSVLRARIYNAPNNKNTIGYLTFGSKIKLVKINKKFSRFENKWIENKNLKPINYIEKEIFNKIKIFKNTSYKWGGKSFGGIDCSALVQIFFNFNKKYCPRDTKYQIKYFKKNIKLNKIKKNDMIYWKGHVAVALSKKKLIHAYGPLKKTVIMDISKIIHLIKKTAKLNVLYIKRL